MLGGPSVAVTVPGYRALCLCSRQQRKIVLCTVHKTGKSLHNNRQAVQLWLEIGAGGPTMGSGYQPQRTHNHHYT